MHMGWQGGSISKALDVLQMWELQSECEKLSPVA